MAKNLLTLKFYCGNQSGPDSEMQLIAKFMYSFIPSLIHSKYWYNPQHHSDRSLFQPLTKDGLVGKH